jgi:hypothetical protein
MSKKMFRSLYCVFFGLVIHCFGYAGMVSFPDAPLLSDFFSTAKNHTQIDLTSEYVMKGDAILKADIIVIDAPIVTNGYQLKIDARNLKFRKSGKIIGFKEPAQSENGIPSQPQKKTKGRSSYEAHHHGTPEKSFSGENGSVGDSGSTGFLGVDGKKDPSFVSVFGAEIHNLVFELNGQEGGKGGIGGKGGDGGDGGDGSDADAKVAQLSQLAGWGGDGGMGGQGGKGGTGGLGGSAIPLILLGLNTIDLKHIENNVGFGGKGGDPGFPGGSGIPGRGGKGDSANIGFFVAKQLQAARSGSYASYPNPMSKGYGDKGGLGTHLGLNHTFLSEFKDSSYVVGKDKYPFVLGLYDKLNDKRIETVDLWFRFHWSRTLKLLVEKSISKVAEIQSNQTRDFSKIGSVLQKMIYSANKSIANQLVSDWNNHFIVHVEGLSQKQQSIVPVQKALEISKNLVDSLKELQLNSPNEQVVLSGLQTSLQSVDELARDDLNKAVDSCSKYNQMLKELKESISTYTTYFEVPVCDGQINYMDSKHTFGSIVTAKSYNKVVPQDFPTDLIDKNKDSKQQEVSKYFSIIRPILVAISKLVKIESAIAGQIVSYLDLKEVRYFYDVELKKSNPLLQPNELKMLDEEKIERNIGYYLQTISVFSGSYNNWSEELIEYKKNREIYSSILEKTNLARENARLKDLELNSAESKWELLQDEVVMNKSTLKPAEDLRSEMQEKICKEQKIYDNIVNDLKMEVSNLKTLQAQSNREEAKTQSKKIMAKLMSQQQEQNKLLTQLQFELSRDYLSGFQEIQKLEDSQIISNYHNDKFTKRSNESKTLHMNLHELEQQLENVEKAIQSWEKKWLVELNTTEY